MCLLMVSFGKMIEIKKGLRGKYILNETIDKKNKEEKDRFEHKDLVFDEWEKLVFWLQQEYPKERLEKIKPKTTEELYER